MHGVTPNREEAFRPFPLNDVKFYKPTNVSEKGPVSVSDIDLRTFAPRADAEAFDIARISILIKHSKFEFTKFFCDLH